MTRKSQPIDNTTRNALDQLDRDYRTAPDAHTARTVADEALNVLAPKTDPKPPSED